MPQEQLDKIITRCAEHASFCCTPLSPEGASSLLIEVIKPLKGPVCRWCGGTGIYQGLQETSPCRECQK